MIWTSFKLSKVVGTVLQDSDGQFVGLTVGEDIAFALENDNVPTAEMRERVAKVAQMVDMDSLLNSSPFELSGGQKQRTSLAGVMIDDVDILLFDEPLANLDPATGKTAIEIIDDIHKQSRKTILIIEHRLEDVLHRDVDRVIVINDGRIIADMDAHDLVSSAVLVDNGIREPLYVTALKYAGVKVTSEMKPGHITTLSTELSGHALQLWHEKVKAADPREPQPFGAGDGERLVFLRRQAPRAAGDQLRHSRRRDGFGGGQERGGEVDPIQAAVRL